MNNQDKFRGCLLGGAAGDALGYAVEFRREAEIFRRYGRPGIREYALEEGLARISDDTQMILYTAAGLLLESEEELPLRVFHCYQDWLLTQQWPGGQPTQGRYTSLNRIPELNCPRAPGGTCLSAIRGGVPGSVERPVNNSKGCGGVMRVAPAGLYYAEGSSREAARLGGELAALTHGHPLGYLPGAALASMVQTLTAADATVDQALEQAIADLESLYAPGEELADMVALLRLAREKAEADIPDLDGIHALGEGWVGDEALAIAVFCALRHPDDFDAAIVAAVNHKGDSDSTGAIAGNLLGARLGLAGIPEKFLTRLELADTITEMADSLCRGYGDWGA